MAENRDIVWKYIQNPNGMIIFLYFNNNNKYYKEKWVFVGYARRFF